jgi:hypothetical protein
MDISLIWEKESKSIWLRNYYLNKAKEFEVGSEKYKYCMTQVSIYENRALALNSLERKMREKK